MTTVDPAPDGSPDAPVDSPSGSALDSDSAVVPAGPAAGDGDTQGGGSLGDQDEATTGGTTGAGEHTGANEAAAEDDDSSPFASAADLQTPGIRDADEHLAASEDALAQAKEIGGELRGTSLPETVPDAQAVPAAPDAEPDPR